jgi:DNA replication protein DnaC
MAACPDGRCDGSGFLYDEARRRAYPCSCRPARLARRRAAAVAGRLPRRFREVSFDREPVVSIERRNPHVVREVRRYATEVAERLEAGRGLWFTGDVGTGKTTLAMLISRAAMQADRTVAIYSLPRLLAMLRETYDDDAAFSLAELIDRLCAVDLLHVDDVGAEQSSPWVLEQLYTIVNTRYEDGRAMLLTTNLDDAALREQIGDRTVSRLYEMCGTPLPMFGEDQRLGTEWRLPEAAPAPAPGWARSGGAGWAGEPSPTSADPWDDAQWDERGDSGYGRPRPRTGERLD